jgi:hypothetical protein
MHAGTQDEAMQLAAQILEDALGTFADEQHP